MKTRGAPTLPRSLTFESIRRPELLGLAATAEAAAPLLDRLMSTLEGVPLFPSTMLDAAELLARHGIDDQAAALLDRTAYGEALIERVLGYDGETNVLDRHFRYWRLRHLIASSGNDLPESVELATNITAGNGVERNALAYSDADAVELSARIDVAVRTLGELDAAALSGKTVPASDAWASLASLLDVFPRPSKPGQLNSPRDPQRAAARADANRCGRGAQTVVAASRSG